MSRSRRPGVRFPSPVPAEPPTQRGVAPQVGERLYSCAEAAEATGTTESFWRALVFQKRVRYVKLSKFVRIPESAIAELLERGTVFPES